MHDTSIHSEHIHERECGKYIGDLVYGGNDGIVTTFAVISGATGAALSPGIIIALGVANLIADGISMGLSNYLALKSRQDYEHEERRREEHEIVAFPAEERLEVMRVLEHWKIPEPHIHSVLASITSDKKRWVDFMMKEELNIVESHNDSPAKHGFVTFGSFVIAGSLPLVPFLLGASTANAFIISIIATAVSLCIVGSLRTLITGANWIRSGIEMLSVGILAALAAYAVGGIVRNISGIQL